MRWNGPASASACSSRSSPVPASRCTSSSAPGTKRVCRFRVARRELSGDDWALVEPLLPIGEYGPYPYRLRGQLEGVVWWLRTGSQWREVPEEFGAWSTI
ncbi:transposase [Streptomyces rimosus]|uniref:transposase n=1 Tax=Streptomyces rimosus TaxID=1927 RepID=UPI0037D86EB6